MHLHPDIRQRVFRRICRVIFMDVGGRILEDTTKDEFFGKIEERQPRTREFLNKILQH